MSHYVVWAILPTSVTLADAEKTIGEKMERYSENRKVPDYQKTCFCVGGEAEIEARKTANATHGTIDDIRTAYFAMTETKERNAQTQAFHRKGKLTTEEKAVYRKLDAEGAAAWKVLFDPYDATLKAAREAHPKAKDANPECEECKGSGHYTTQYNPESKWDWYRVGGRWDGAIQNRDADSKDNGFNSGDEHETVAKNHRLLCEMPTPLPEGYAPFGFLLPDGEWAEKGKMGWWAMVHDEKENWDETAQKIVDKYREGHYAIALDLHI